MGLVLKPAGWREALAELQRRVGELFGRPEPRRGNRSPPLRYLRLIVIKR
jgi:hypothetical protein